MDKILVYLDDDERFEGLCESLNMESLAERMQVAGHLHTWRITWARNRAFEHGLFFGVPLSRMDTWAQWVSPLRDKQLARDHFGRALLKHGFIKELEKLFPAAVLELAAPDDKRSGFVAMNPGASSALDDAWGMHRSRSDAGKLVLFLTHPAWRSVRAFDAGWSESSFPALFGGQSPWLIPVQQARAMLRRRGYEEEIAGPSGGASGGPPAGEPRGNRGDSAGMPQGFNGGTAPVPSPPTVLNGKERNLNNGNSVNISDKRYTGTPKSEGLRQAMRERMYPDPLGALLLLDTAKQFEDVARAAVRANPEGVRGLISTITDQGYWLSISAPRPSVVFIKPLRVLTQQARDRRAPTAEDGGGAPHVGNGTVGGEGTGAVPDSQKGHAFGGAYA